MFLLLGSVSLMSLQVRWNTSSSITWDIENTRFVSFDIKFTRQGFENAC